MSVNRNPQLRFPRKYLDGEKKRWRAFLDIEREKGFRNNLKLSSIIDGTEMRELKDELQSYKGV